MLSRRIIYTFIVAFWLVACSEDSITDNPIIKEPEIIRGDLIRIPVVVHVLYYSDEFNISNEKVFSQIEVLNKDYRKKNDDHVKVPQEFAHLVADVGIEFELATKDPYGKLTNGITRTYSTLQGWDGNDPGKTLPVENLPLYFTAKGGHDAWPTDRYLNIWVVEMSDHVGRVGMAGYAHFPGDDARIDGVVIDPRVFGTTPPLMEGHKFGRTATHEVGHWLNLIHIFAQRTCESSDLVEDTPSSAVSYNGNPTYPQSSCGHSTMFMNFMDYVDDDAMYMFTHGQKERMRAVFKPDGQRHSLCLDCK